MNLPVLPTYYYHDHFTELVRFVTETYGSVLTEAQHAFFARFGNLSKDAQCLLIRMINRRGRIFRSSTFRYAEIADIDRGLRELAEAGHVRMLVEDDFAAFLSCLSKEALLKAARSAALVDIRSSWPKVKLAEHLIAHLSFDTAYIYCCGKEFVALGNIEPIEFLLYLYFGKTQGDLKNFALRDLGILRTNKQTNFSARFSDGGEARACFYYSRLLDRLDITSDDVYRKTVTASPAPTIRPRFDRIASTSAPAVVCARIPAAAAIDITIPMLASASSFPTPCVGFSDAGFSASPKRCIFA
jgi:DNA polymerase-3 subunit epsilon